jgi:shikimate dehydrogenase
MHNAGMEALGLNWRYLAFDVPPVELRDAIQGARTLRFVGLNLTVPHKLLALEMVDELDTSARQWGAVNTIRFEARDAQGKWRPLAQSAGTVAAEIRAKGFNTDADALARALREELDWQPLPGAGVLILGAGGAARVVALKLASEGGSNLFLVNRTVRKAEAMAVEIRKRFSRQKVTVGYPKNKVDLVINATSLGLQPGDDLPFDSKQFSLQQTGGVYDLIYRPAETPLLKAAKAAGCRTANGLGMLLYQGAKALEIWSDKPAPLGVMRRALEQEIYRK